jgi:predicted Rossmann-fold nucleotide-binding protein
MKIGIVGSNSITDLSKIYTTLYQVTKEVSPTSPPVFLGGGGKGVASIVKEFARDNNIDYVELSPFFMLDTNVPFSSKYFFIRTKQIIDNSDFVVFFLNEDCKEVNYGIKYTQRKRIDYLVVKIPKTV